MKLNLILIIALILMALPMGNAEIFKQANGVDLKITCMNNGTYCSATAKCNITVFYPNNTMLINNLQMTNQEAFHNFTIIKEYTIETGNYPCLVSCKDGIYNGWQKCDYEVTATGSSSMNSNWIITLMIIVAWLLFILCLVFNNNIIGFFAGMMLIIVGVFIYIQGIASVKNLLTEGTGIIHIGIGLIIMIITSYNLAKE